MIRFGWLQFRTQAAVAAGLLAVVAVTLVITGAHLRYLYDASGLAACPPHGDCAALTGALLTRLRGYAAFPVIYWAGIFVLYAVPAIIGMFWGAPLITRELEAGTMRLAWTQGVTRARWLAVKLGLAGLASMAAAGLLSLMVTWWAGPVDPLDPYGMNKLQPAMFGTRGIVPIGYAAFAFVLGVTVGMLVRSTVAAMAATPVIVAAVEGAMIAWVRPHLIAPVRATSALNLASVQDAGGNAGVPASSELYVSAALRPPGSWVYSTQVLSASGRTSLGPEPRVCVSGSWQACVSALGKLHLQQTVTYQPASRYWALQSAETAVLVALAIALAGFCFWWIRRHLPG
jgi:hypothetical protein